jgi:hypothetical protein
MTHPRDLTPAARWEAETSLPERLLSVALADPMVSPNDKARFRRTMLATVIARLEALAAPHIPQQLKGSSNV